jgi:hypothetical protein
MLAGGTNETQSHVTAEHGHRTTTTKKEQSKATSGHKINLNASHIFTHRPYVLCAFGPINNRTDSRGTTASQGRPLTSSGRGGSRSWKSSDKPILWSFVSIFLFFFSCARRRILVNLRFQDPARFSLSPSVLRAHSAETLAADLYLHQVIARVTRYPRRSVGRSSA